MSFEYISFLSENVPEIWGSLLDHHFKTEPKLMSVTSCTLGIGHCFDVRCTENAFCTQNVIWLPGTYSKMDSFGFCIHCWLYVHSADIIYCYKYNQQYRYHNAQS